MRILGISAFYHDSAAALIEDGELIAAASEERFTRKKHDPDFPLNAIRYCLKKGDIQAGDLDYVGFYDKPFVTVAINRNAEIFHDGNGHVNVRSGHQAARNRNGDRFFRKGGDHQQRGQILTADAAVDRHAAPLQTAADDLDRRTSIGIHRTGADTHLIQSDEQVLDRPLLHPL